MIRNLRAFGLALVAVVALSAVVASAASATSFDSEASPTKLVGLQKAPNIFTTEAGEVACSEAEFIGEVTGTSTTEITVHPDYRECETIGLPTDVTTTGCDYLFTAAPETTATVHVVCGGSNVISLTPTFLGTPICHITVGSQTPGGVVDLKNEGGPTTTRDVLVTATIKEITYTVHGGEGLCGTEGLHHDGTYTGSVTLKGFNPANNAQRGIFVTD